MTTPLDRENISSFLLTVQAKDGFPSALALSSQLEVGDMGVVMVMCGCGHAGVWVWSWGVWVSEAVRVAV